MLAKKEFYFVDKAVQFSIDFLLFVCLVISEYLSNGISMLFLNSSIFISDIALNIMSSLTAEGLTQLSKTLTGFVLLATAAFRFYHVIKEKKKK